jgi:hypothetical protein
MTDDILEAAARALREIEDKLDLRCGDDSDAQKVIHALIVVVTPLIRADALEEAAKVTEDYDRDGAFAWMARDIAAAIRALKEQP